MTLLYYFRQHQRRQTQVVTAPAVIGDRKRKKRVFAIESETITAKELDLGSYRSEIARRAEAKRKKRRQMVAHLVAKLMMDGDL